MPIVTSTGTGSIRPRRRIAGWPRRRCARSARRRGSAASLVAGVLLRLPHALRRDEPLVLRGGGGGRHRHLLLHAAAEEGPVGAVVVGLALRHPLGLADEEPLRVVEADRVVLAHGIALVFPVAAEVF